MAKIQRVTFYPRSDAQPMQNYPDLQEIRAMQGGATVDLNVMTDAGAVDREETYGFEFGLTPAAARELAAQLVEVAERTERFAARK